VGEHEYLITVPLQGLAAGKYRLSLDLETAFNIYHDRLEDCISFDYSPLLRNQEQPTLQQSWNAGYFVLPAVVKRVRSFENVT
jgi:hypothetical protein